MPNIFDNIELRFLPELESILGTAHAADFCVGYFNLRGWGPLGRIVEERFKGGDGECCRLLVGMQTPPEDEIRALYGMDGQELLDQTAAVRAKRKIADEFRRQLVIGIPTDKDEAALRLLSSHLKSNKLRVRLFLRRGLHAKLYLAHRRIHGSAAVGYVGSSNLTFSGIVTTSDLSTQFRALSEPFLLLSEIENYLRALIDAKFTVEDLQAAKDPADADREITGASDMTFGEYLRLLQNEEKWAKLGVSLDRKAFVAKLDEVRVIRNDVMHFDPEGIDEKDLDALRAFAKFLLELRMLNLF